MGACHQAVKHEYSILLSSQPYCGVILEYLRLEEMFSRMVVLSKYHLNFMKNNENKVLILHKH